MSEDSIYSRHLQRHVALTIITTPMPEEKKQMNLLLFNEGKDALADIRAKKIIDSLYRKKLIQPLTLVAFEGGFGDYGLEEAPVSEAKGYKQFNDFVSDELYPFIKKKVVIRKFNSVAVWGYGSSALSAFDIAWNHDEKIQKTGMSYPIFFLGSKVQDSATLSVIKSLRKRPALDYWINAYEEDSAAVQFANMINVKSKNEAVKFLPAGDLREHRKTDIPEIHFADFLLWAFGK